MKSIKPISIIALIAMAIISFSNLFGLNIAGLSVLIGIAFFFISKALNKQAFKDSGLDMKSIGSNLKDKKIWLWIALPLIMDAISIGISKLFLPEYIDHVLARTEIFVSFDKFTILIIQLAILALGEEIAWRSFFQKQLGKVMPIIPVLIFSSILFALGHLNAGNTVVVIYDLFFIFINSILYGIVFNKTNNAWISGISHFSANLFSIIIFLLL